MIEYTPTFTIGYNTPGYLPEMEPYVIEGMESAREAMLDEIDRHAEHAVDAACMPLVGVLEDVMTDLRTADITQGWDAYPSDPERKYDLGTHYWIAPGGVIEEDE